MNKKLPALLILLFCLQTGLISQSKGTSKQSQPEIYRDSKECRYGIQVPLQSGENRRSELAENSYDLNPALAPDEVNMKRLIDSNRDNFEFINVAISNMLPPGVDPKKANEDADRMEAEGDKMHDKNQLDSPYFYDFRRASQKDLEGNVYFFKGDYSLAVRPLRESQRLLKDIYEDVLERHNEHTRVMITYASNRIIRTKDISSRHLLKLAFKELKNAEIAYCMGWNTSPAQYRKKIWHYEDGIRASRKARRFTILSLMDYNTPKDEQKLYKKEKLNEFKDPAYDGSVNNYEYLKKTLRNFIENKWIEPKISAKIAFERPNTSKEINYEANPVPIDLMEILDDCYGIITYNRISILEETNKFLRREQAREESVDNNTPEKIPAPTKTEAVPATKK